jgi:uncharacterized protein Usg
MRDFEGRLNEYRLTEAEILYNPPNQPHLLECLIWQDYDVAPDFPELCKFLRFWTHHVDVPLFAVRVESLGLVRPPGLVYAAYSTAIH